MAMKTIVAMNAATCTAVKVSRLIAMLEAGDLAREFLARAPYSPRSARWALPARARKSVITELNFHHD
jgi:hypothetical protein